MLSQITSVSKIKRKYGAEEVWRVDEPNPASDIYALGISIYEMLTGEVTYNYEYHADVLNFRPNLPISDYKKISGKVMPVIRAACEKKPENRPNQLELAESFRIAVYE